METLDVRPDLASGKDPFGRIMATVEQMKGPESLELLAPFEPAPLYAVLAAKGYSHRSERLPGGDWKVTFTRG